MAQADTTAASARTVERTALVTGATGFTGGHLVRRLLSEGWRVRALVRQASQAERLSSQGIEPRLGDIRDRTAVCDAAQGVHTVFHIAAAFRIAGQTDDFYRGINVLGTENVLAAVRRHHISRFVHCSTIGVHGNVKDIPGDETSPISPGDIYQETKAEAEERVNEAFGEGLQGSIVRPAGIYGPGDLRFLKLFRTIAKRRFVMIGTGETVWHPVYVEDLVTGILLAGSHPAALGETFIIAGDRYVSLNDLVALVARSVGVSTPALRIPYGPVKAAAVACEALCRPFGIEPPLHRRRADFFTKNRAFSTDKASRLLQYRPAIMLPDGIDRTAAWYVSQGLITGRPAAGLARAS